MLRSHANHSSTKRLAIAAVLTSCAGLGAQTTSISPSAATVDGGSNYILPYSWYPVRYQQIYDHNSFSHGSSVLRISEVAYRLFKPRRGNTVPTDSEITVHLAYAARGIDSTSFGEVFDRNTDSTTRKLCVSRKKVNMPNIGTGAFGFVIKFDSNVSFVYDPSLKRSLVLDVLKWDAYGKPAYLIDTVADDRKGAGIARAFTYESVPGRGEWSSLESTVHCHLQSDVTCEVRQLDSPSNDWRVTVRHPSVGIPTMVLLSDRKIRARIPELICDLRVVPQAILSGRTNAFGRFEAEFSLPRQAWRVLYVQAAATAPNSVGGSMTLSSASRLMIGSGLSQRTAPNRYPRAACLHHKRGHVTAFR